jgi:hypothetical protein
MVPVGTPVVRTHFHGMHDHGLISASANPDFEGIALIVRTEVEIHTGTDQDRDVIAVGVQDALVANTPLPSRFGNFRQPGNPWDLVVWGLGVWRL